MSFAAMRQIPLPIGGAVPRSFDTFLPGRNAPALVQLTEWLQQHADGGAAPPVYLWGARGCGKTHLLQSLAERLSAVAQPTAVFNALTPLPWRPDHAPALTVFDDCESFDADRQRAAFALFVDATSRGALIAAAGRMPPVDLPLRDDLRTRLGWGHVITLHPLTEAEVALVLHDEAARRGITLPDELRAYLLSHFSRDLKSLMDLLERVYEFAHVHKRALTVPMIKQMLNEDHTLADAAP